MNDIIIIGGGIGGSAAALRAAQNGMKTHWVLGSKLTRKRSRSQWVRNLDNIVGFHEDIIKDQVIKTLRKHHQEEAAVLIRKEHYHINNRMLIRNTIQRIEKKFQDVIISQGEVSALKKIKDRFEITKDDELILADAVVLATGIMDEQPSILKKNRKGNWENTPRWIYPFANREQVLYCIRCEGHLTKEDHTAVIGFSNTAAELAMMLYERYRNKVTILSNGDVPNISNDRIRILKQYGIEIITDPIVDLLSEGVKQLHGFVFEEHNPVEVKFALVSLGIHRVYNDLARQLGARLMDEHQPVEKRHVWINHKGETSIRGLFAVGDMAKRDDEPVMKQVYTAQEYAVRAVDTIDSRRRKASRNNILYKD